MFHGVPNMEEFDQELWKADNLPEAHFDDALWGYMIWMSEQFRTRVLGAYGDDVCQGHSHPDASSA
jgi:hypothetical protein